jgi:predicted CXXCH cytochrome family protein
MQPVTEQQWTWAGRELREMEKVLFFNSQLPEAERGLFHLAGGCAYCHLEKKRAGPPRAIGDLPEYLKTDIRERWLPHARFGHDSHRMLGCTQCHDAEKSSQTADVLMPRMETCARCHNPKVGVRSDCAECHRYHNRGYGYQPHKDWTIDEGLGLPRGN